MRVKNCRETVGSQFPRGPKDQKHSRFRSRLKSSIENEIFERATHRGPIFYGGNRDIEIKIFERDQKFRSRSNFFDRWALREHLAHKQFLGHPGHRSSRPGTRILPAGHSDENVYVPGVLHTAHKLLTPGHRSGDPPPHPVGETPPPTRAVTGKICLCLCAFSFPELCSPFLLQI